MVFSLRLLPNEVAVRLPSDAGPDPDVFATSVTFIAPSQHYGALSYEDLRSLGDGMWELPGEPAAWTRGAARRVELDLSQADSDPPAAASDPSPRTTTARATSTSR
jgi:hypothetical protein